MPRPLNIRQQRFAEALVKGDGNQTEAARAAGYNGKYLAGAAVKLLKDPRIQSLIAKRRAEWTPQYKGVTVDDVVRELTTLAFADVTECFDPSGELLPVNQWPAAVRRCVSSFEVVIKNAAAGDGVVDRVLKVRFSEKTKALELLARYLGMLVERREVGGPGAFAELSDIDLARRIHAASSRLAAIVEGESVPEK